MGDPVITGDFLGSNTEQRLSKCRQFAAEAGLLAAAAANPETQHSYLELRRQWEDLAAELEAMLRAGESNPAP